MNILLILNIILPILASIAAFFRSQAIAKYFTTIISLLLVINNFFLALNDGSELLKIAVILGYEVSLKADTISAIFSLIVAILYLANNFYSFYYLKIQENSILSHDLNFKIHFFFMPLAIMASFNIAYSSNLITLFIFYELLTLTTYPLVIQSFSAHACKAGRIYFATLFGTSSVFLIFALIFLDYYYGDSSFSLGGMFVSNNSNVRDFVILLVCFVFGFSKTAIFPFSHWLPSAMVAPVPVSSLLHAVAVVKSGIFALFKVFFYLFGLDYMRHMHNIFPWAMDSFTLLSCFTIIYAGIMACRQDSIKKMLAYSTISQLSYMLLTLSLLKYDMLLLWQILAHSIAKITLFFLAGAIYLQTHLIYIKDLKGLAKNSLPTVILFTLACASIIGLPFTTGSLILGELYHIIPHTDLGLVVILCLTISSLLSCYYYAKTIFYMLCPGNITTIDNANSLVMISAITLSALLAFYFYLIY
jgi:multicomponent Na+:H+ antiporter subunit D